LNENAQDIIQQTLHSNSKYPSIRAMYFFIKSLEKMDLQKETSKRMFIYCEIIKDFIYSYNDDLMDLKHLLGSLNS
jgi:hypothetical protein